MLFNVASIFLMTNSHNKKYFF